MAFWLQKTDVKLRVALSKKNKKLLSSYASLGLLDFFELTSHSELVKPAWARWCVRYLGQLPWSCGPSKRFNDRNMENKPSMTASQCANHRLMRGLNRLDSRTIRITNRPCKAWETQRVKFTRSPFYNFPFTSKSWAKRILRQESVKPKTIQLYIDTKINAQSL